MLSKSTEQDVPARRSVLEMLKPVPCTETMLIQCLLVSFLSIWQHFTVDVSVCINVSTNIAFTESQHLLNISYAPGTEKKIIKCLLKVMY